MRTTPPETPGAIIGYRRNGTPIHLAAGGSESLTEPAPAPAPPADPAAAGAPAPAPEPPQPSPAAPGEPAASGQEPPGAEPASVDKLPPWAQREFKKLREEAAGNRVRAKEAADAVAALRAEQEQQRDAFARALGLKTDEPPTADQLAEQLTQSQTAAQQAAERARQSDVKLAVFQQAAAAKADGNALLDSVQFLRALDGLDPSGDDFGSRVKAAIETALEANPRYKLDAGPAAPAPRPEPRVPSSGPGNGQFTGPPQGPRQWTEADVENADAAAVAKALDDGLLVNLGFGKPKAKR